MMNSSSNQILVRQFVCRMVIQNILTYLLIAFLGLVGGIGLGFALSVAWVFIASISGIVTSTFGYDFLRQSTFLDGCYFSMGLGLVLGLFYVSLQVAIRLCSRPVVVHVVDIQCSEERDYDYESCPRYLVYSLLEFGDLQISVPLPAYPHWNGLALAWVPWFGNKKSMPSEVEACW